MAAAAGDWQQWAAAAAASILLLLLDQAGPVCALVCDEKGKRVGWGVVGACKVMKLQNTLLCKTNAEHC
jgi:hypothetical protein